MHFLQKVTALFFVCFFNDASTSNKFERNILKICSNSIKTKSTKICCGTLTVNISRTKLCRKYTFVYINVDVPFLENNTKNLVRHSKQGK